MFEQITTASVIYQIRRILALSFHTVRFKHPHWASYLCLYYVHFHVTDRAQLALQIFMVIIPFEAMGMILAYRVDVSSAITFTPL
jgi:hypothetical protein